MVLLSGLAVVRVPIANFSRSLMAGLSLILSPAIAKEMILAEKSYNMFAKSFRFRWKIFIDKFWNSTRTYLLTFSFKSTCLFLILFSCSTSLSALTLSSELGKIQKTLPGSNGKTVYLVQEAHVDYEAQKALVRVLEAILVQESVKLILVEGGWGDVSLTEMRGYGKLEERKKIADKYLTQGKISAEEYLDIAGEHEFELWGVEDPKLYGENLEAFLKFHSIQVPAQAQLKKVEEAFSRLSDEVYSDRLKKLSNLRRDYNSGAISLFTYLSELLNRSSPNEFVRLRRNPSDGRIAPVFWRIGDPLDSRPASPPGGLKYSGMTEKPKTFGADKTPNANNLSSYPTLSQLAAFLEEQGSFGSAKIQDEKNQVIAALSRRSTKSELVPLRRRLKENEPANDLELLDEIFRLLARYPDLEKTRAAQHLKIYREAFQEMTNSQELMTELSDFERSIFDHLAITGEEKKLMELDFLLGDLFRLFSLQLGPLEWARLKKSLNEWSADQMNAELSEIARAKHQKWGGERAARALWQSIPIAAAFYERALEREDALIRNAVSKMEQSAVPAAILITGGFHSDPLAEQIQSKGYTVVKISPSFKPSDPKKAQEKYFKVLQEKWKTRIKL